MKKKPSLDEMDMVFDPTPLTEDEKRLISEYIRQDKAKRRKKHFAHQRTAGHAIAASR